MSIIEQLYYLLIFLLTLMPFVLIAQLLFRISIDNKKILKLSLPVALIMGPVFLSILLELIIRYFPKENNMFYLLYIPFIGISLVVFLLFYCYKKKLFLQGWQYKNIKSVKSKTLIEDNTLTILFIISMIFLFLATLFGFLIENDPLEYASTAKTIYQQKDLTHYPFVDTNFSDGYYGPWTHGLGYINLWVWSYLVAEFDGITNSARFISVYYLLALNFFIIKLSEVFLKTLHIGKLAAIFLCISPVIIGGVIGSHIDIIRIALLFNSLILFYIYLQKPSLKFLIFMSLSVGLALYTHSLNILLFPIIAILWLIHEKKISLSMLKDGFIFLFFSLLFVIPSYIINIKLFGLPIADSGAVPVWGLPNLHYDEWFFILRDLESQVSRLFYGVLKGFTRPDWFGLSYYFFIGAFYYYVSGILKKSGAESCLLTKYLLKVILIFFSFVFITYIFGYDIFIKNYRYQMTIQPFIAFFSAVMLYKYLLIKKNNA